MDFLLDDEVIILYYLARKKKRKKQQRHLHSRYRKDFYGQLSLAERRRRDRRIPRIALQAPRAAAAVAGD